MVKIMLYKLIWIEINSEADDNTTTFWCQAFALSRLSVFKIDKSNVNQRQSSNLMSTSKLSKIQSQFNIDNAFDFTYVKHVSDFAFV